MSDEEKEKETPSMVDISAIDIYSLIGLFINILNTQAWQYMGLRINPSTKKIEKDMAKAIVAIDIIAYLIDKLEIQLNEEERARLRSLISDLQINFIRQQKPSEKNSEQK